MRCDHFKDLLDRYLDDDLDHGEREGWRAHLRECTECQSWARTAEPTLLFAAVPTLDPDPHKVADCITRVEASIRVDQIQRRLHSGRTRWFVAAAAALVVAAGVTWQLSGPGLNTLPDGGVSSVRVDTARPQPPPPEVEVDMDGEGVRIYHFAADEDENTAVVFVVNPALEL